MKNVRKMLIAGIVALTATVGVGVPQTSAATSTTACFKWAAGTPAAGTPYMNRAVQLWQTNSAGTPTAKVRDGRTGSNGCATFYNTPSNMNLRMRAVHVDQFWWGSAVYEGWTQRIALPGQGGVLLGVGYVQQIA
jgi:hypothetical protein